MKVRDEAEDDIVADDEDDEDDFTDNEDTDGDYAAAPRPGGRQVQRSDAFSVDKSRTWTHSSGTSDTTTPIPAPAASAAMSYDGSP